MFLIFLSSQTQKRKIAKAEKAYNKQVAKEKEGVKDESKIEQFLANQAPSSGRSTRDQGVYMA